MGLSIKNSFVFLLLLLFSLVLFFQNCSKMELNSALKGSSSNNSGLQNTDQPPMDNSQGDAVDAFFNTEVLPTFQAQCMQCHSEGGSAPLSIFDYSDMVDRLANGNSGTDNELFNKVTNQIFHGGGDRCAAGGFSQSPCKELSDWWNEEFGPADVPPPANNGNTSGAITSTDDFGRIRGYAVDSNDGSRVLEVRFYIGGPAGVGENVGTVRAELQGPLGDVYEGHYFDFTLPDQFRDGQLRQLYVYADGTSQQNALGNPLSMAAYKLGESGDPGFDYFESTLRPLLVSSCANCHNINYSDQFIALLSPSPQRGGTATINRLINKASGMDNHGGGARCASKNASPCSEMQTWWAMEF